jgi:hypothetical protein
VTAREDVEAELDPERFAYPALARSLATDGRFHGGTGSEPDPELGIEELINTLGEFVFAFRAALLDLADRVDALQKPHAP